MFPEEVKINEKNIEKLRETYQKAYTQIVAELENATSFGSANRRAILAQIEKILKELGAEVNEFIEEEITTYYQEGAGDAVKQLDKVADEIPVATGFNKIHKEAILALVDDTQTAFGDSLTGVSRTARKLLSTAVKEQLTQQLATGKIQGSALKTIQKNLIAIIKADGIESFIDKGGKKWKLDRYTELLIRTKAVEARNRGLANRMAENEYDLVQVSAHGGCDLCAPWEGRILSVTGKTPGYPTVAQAQRAGLFHPNCKHAINALVPELAKVTHAYNPNINTLTGSEFVDEVDEKFKGLVKPATQVVKPRP